MGLPQHYSLELPERCLHLVKELLPSVERIRVPGQEHLGPLTTTFILAMSTPMITLPIERIERHRLKPVEGYMDERALDPTLAANVDQALGSGPLMRSPFFEEGHWRFATLTYAGQNLAKHFPNDLSSNLASPDALRAAANMAASEWASILRNALAHGGIVYLDSEGSQSHGQNAEMLAFVSAKYLGRDTSQPPNQLKVLRITEAHFFLFLNKWVEWLRTSGLSQAMAA